MALIVQKYSGTSVGSVERIMAVAKSAIAFLSVNMNRDLWVFIGCAGLLISYLFFSAATEMGTKLPWRK